MGPCDGLESAAGAGVTEGIQTHEAITGSSAEGHVILNWTHNVCCVHRMKKRFVSCYFPD